jgi:hypothetical protein
VFRADEIASSGDGKRKKDTVKEIGNRKSENRKIGKSENRKIGKSDPKRAKSKEN